MVHGFDSGATIKSTLEKRLGIRITFIIFTDSKSLYECLVKLGTIREKRLMIDLMCLCQSYERREISHICWVNGGCNPADAMTKYKCSNALRDFINTYTIKIDNNEWVERDETAEEFGQYCPYITILFCLLPVYDDVMTYYISCNIWWLICMMINDISFNDRKRGSGLMYINIPIFWKEGNTKNKKIILQPSLLP